MDALVNAVERLVTDYGYLGIFLLSLASSACIPFPNEVTMMLGGWYAADGRLSFVAVVVLGILGNLAGSLVTYWVGRWKGRPFIERYGRYVMIRPHDIDRAERWWDRHGEAATFFSRLLPVLRSFISLPAGIAEMPFGRFLVYSLLGIVPWTIGLAWLGLVVKDRWHDVLSYFDWPTAIIAVALVTAAVVWEVRRRRARNPSQH
ncbi:MAG TPA: DedA family protein [Actinomycetota bacterium]|nr:DedA family protein [Actinomycetota bacterium]